MLTIVCGEDTPQARDKFHSLINEFKSKGTSPQHIPNTKIEELLKNATGVLDLFGQPLVYITEFVSKKYKGRVKTPFKEALKQLSLNTEIQIISWEGGLSAYDLSGIKKIATNFYEAKPKKSIFDLLDSCYPGNLSAFINMIDLVSINNEDFFVYTMLRNHIRKIFLISEGIEDTKSAPFQKIKNKQLVAKWDKLKLRSFYERLLNIDTKIRTGETIYGYLDSLKLLVCYYLK